MKRKRLSVESDRGRAEAGGGGSAGGGADAPSGDQSADPCIAGRSSTRGWKPDQGRQFKAIAGRERAAEAVVGGADVGPFCSAILFTSDFTAISILCAQAYLPLLVRLPL